MKKFLITLSIIGITSASALAITPKDTYNPVKMKQEGFSQSTIQVVTDQRNADTYKGRPQLTKWQKVYSKLNPFYAPDCNFGNEGIKYDNKF